MSFLTRLAMPFASLFDRLFSVTFERPEVLAGLWGLLLVPLLYLARRRARRAAVPHVFLFERLLRLEGKAKRRRLREIIGMILQMLIAASMIIACAEPRRETSRPRPRHVLVVLDGSLAMSARDATGMSRMERAVAWLDERLPSMLGGGGRRDEVTIVVANESMRTIVARTARVDLDLDHMRSDLAAALESRGTADVAAWLRFLERTRDDRHHAIVVTAGAGADVEEWSELIDAGVEIVDVTDDEVSVANTAIVDCEWLGRVGDEVTLRVRVRRFGAAWSGGLRLLTDTADDREPTSVHRVSLSLPRDGEKTIEIRAKAPPDVWLRLRLEHDLPDPSSASIPDDASTASTPESTSPPEPTRFFVDGFDADDRVDIWSARSERFRVVLSGPAVDVYLRNAVRALGDVVDGERSGQVPPESWRDVEDVDLFILAGLEEKRGLPNGSYLLLDSSAPRLPIEIGERVEDVAVLRQKPVGDLLRGLDLRDLDVDGARRVTTKSGVEETDVTVVLEGSSGALISRGHADGVHFVHLAFDPSPANSSLALLPSYPLLVKDTLFALAPDRRRLVPPVAPAGSEVAAIIVGDINETSTAVPLFRFDVDDDTDDTDNAETRRLDVVAPGPVVMLPSIAGRGVVVVGGREERIGLGLLSETHADDLEDVFPRNARMLGRPIQRQKRLAAPSPSGS